MASDPVAELDSLLDRWRREIYGNSGSNPVPILENIADLLERETETYLKLPIDPFDDRHPSRAYPECSLGALLKTLFKNENFMSELTSTYLTARANFELNVVSCRLLIDVLPGLDSSVVFMDSEVLVRQLLDWAENAEFPLHAYATALLASVMEVPGIAALHREQNNHLVPIMFNRLHQLTHGLDEPSTAEQSSDNIDPKELVDIDLPNRKSSSKSKQLSSDLNLTNGVSKRTHDQLDYSDDESGPTKMVRRSSQMDLIRSPVHNECSSSSWAEAYMSGSYQMNPPSTVMHQRFILQYLASLGEYQELLVHIFEHKAISYILQFIDGRKNQDVRLAFDALKFLASFLTHKKFALEFLDHGGLAHLLRVSRHGMASTGVSVCLYTLAYNEDVMERICWMKREIVEKMVSYGLWLLECSHDSSRAHAALFFASCFQFPILLKLFDRDNGLRKLLNVISMRGLFSDDPMINELSDDEVYARRQTAKQVTLALKKYTRAHFILETRKHNRTSLFTGDIECRPTIISDENFTEAIEQHRLQSFHRFNWHAIDKIVNEDGLLYLLKLIAHFWNEGFLFTEKTETVRNALEVLVVCSLSPKVKQLLLSKVIRTNSPYAIDHPALAIIVVCADPKIDDADCKKSALNILINLVHSEHPTPPPVLNISVESQDPNRSGTVAKRKSLNLPVALRRAIWENSGTLVLPKLLTVSSPLTEADKIRALTCRVLCGLAKEESIRQIMSKLPLFTDGQLQSFMKEPILPEKRLEHATFCKYCRELIELVTGTPVTSESGVEPSLAEIKRRRVVSKTKIVYDEAEADHIIYNHLLSRGYHKAASEFYKESNLSSKMVATPVAKPRSPPIQEQSQNSGTNSSNPITPSNKRSVISNCSPAPIMFRQHYKNPNTNSGSNSHRKSLMMQKSTFQPSHLFKKLSEPSHAPPITLDTIFTDYLRNQHSQCKNPVAICPPFKLLEPHSCPEPTNRLSAPLNIVSRIIRRAAYPPRGGINGAKYDRHYVYSKFRPLRLVKDPMDVRTSSTCCAFSTDGQFLFVGTDNGLLKAFNVSTGFVEASYECHLNELGSIQASKDDNLILTTSPDSPSPQCVLWTFNEIFERKFRFDNDLHAEFGKATSDRIITTQELYARLWDTETGSLLHKFESHHRYTENRATLNYNDILVLNDGVLWDVRAPTTPVHKFPKFNERINGIFHPNGNEIICNAHIWDIRNFRSLRTVQAFDMCQLKFNNAGDVIFSTLWDDQSEISSKSNCEFKTSFRTFDSYDYSTISTIDLKRTISGLAVSPGDQYIALIESSEKARYFHDEYVAESNVCRLYEIGRPKYDPNIDFGDEDESAEDEENDDDDDDDDEEDEDEDEDDEDVDDEDEEDSSSDVRLDQFEGIDADDLIDGDYDGYETDEILEM
jgi:HIV-1 Vpr-binding protein